MALDLLPTPASLRTGPLPLALARVIRSILAAPAAEPGDALSLADNLEQIAHMGGGVFDSTADELLRGAFVLREMSPVLGTRLLTALEADRSVRR